MQRFKLEYTEIKKQCITVKSSVVKSMKFYKCKKVLMMWSLVKKMILPQGYKLLLMLQNSITMVMMMMMMMMMMIICKNTE